MQPFRLGLLLVGHGEYFPLLKVYVAGHAFPPWKMKILAYDVLPEFRVKITLKLLRLFAAPQVSAAATVIIPDGSESSGTTGAGGSGINSHRYGFSVWGSLSRC